MKHILAIALAFLLLHPVTAQENNPGLKNFLNQSAILLRDGGKWITPNDKFDPNQQWSPSHYGYQFSSGIHPNTYHLKITGYFRKNSQWTDFWQGYYAWDPVKKKVICQSVNNSGEVSTGASTTINENEMVLEFSINKPDGKIEKHRDLHKISDEQLTSHSYIQKNGKWEANGSMNWTRTQAPTGKLLFMSTRDGSFEIYTMDANGENLKNLSCNIATDYAFSYFPDGRLSFYSNRDGNDEIYVMDSTGKKQRNLTNHLSGDRVARVSPDGTKIIFSSNRDNKNSELYIMDSSGKNIIRLTNNESFEDAADFSPDGKKIIFSRDIADKVDTAGKPISNGEIFVMDIDGKNETRLTHHTGFYGGPVLSPDGKKIAFYGKTGGNSEILLMDADGKNIVNLTEDPLEDYSPAWSADGKWIAYTKGNSSNYDVWVINLETKIKTRLTTQPKRDESPIWVPATHK